MDLTRSAVTARGRETARKALRKQPEKALEVREGLQVFEAGSTSEPVVGELGEQPERDSITFENEMPNDTIYPAAPARHRGRHCARSMMACLLHHLPPLTRRRGGDPMIRVRSRGCGIGDYRPVAQRAAPGAAA
ncbi:hypothetical protein [Actinoplanes regularis]|uniref:hypothetical protein n=1 Tax=Actinoplanes regularis TaxID=52697 RepID=UPI001177F41D|nr:hypothetical protein [Actinoplanes regularis]GIE90757.1 hypothetical protein Are01nite_72370 [Actinoplanes regularis]